ncbi:vesicular glutamate transporter 3-like isoform X2 [Haliotis rubra]|uniref:vesicular glutamate transporter 3-like isoform X2 n=1 Tax=Haliotis rubra TaxID=36100 RepID=UPI001EE551D6|nr:vesicular glutamate transporter 3-like isoform X2 [Haliotis rubra]
MKATQRTEMHHEEVLRKPNIPVWYTKRYQLALLYSMGFAVQGLLMYNLSISIVCMVDHQYISGPAGTNDANVSSEINISFTMPHECSGEHNTTTSRECGQAVIYPSMATFWSKWAPPNEYSSIVSVCISGSTIGNAVVYPIGGVLCGDDFSLGWPFIFYTTGGIAALWTLLWILLARNQPSQVPSISTEEKSYIEASLRHRVQMSRVRRIPWRSMFTSRPVYALMADNFLTNYGLYMLLTQMPTYFNDVHRLDFSSNGAYSMVPVVCMGIATFVCGFLADLLISRKLCSVGVTRKITITLGTLLPGICMVILAQAEHGQHLFAVSMLCLAVGFVGFGMCGFSTNYVDIAGQFAGILSGIGNAIGSLPGVLAPYVVSRLTPNGTRSEWQLVFYVTAGIASLATVIYIPFGSGELQPWAQPKDVEQTVFIEKPTLKDEVPVINGSQKDAEEIISNKK